MINVSLYEIGAQGCPSFGWNYYAAECLKGHAEGIFGQSEVCVRVGRIYDNDDLLAELEKIDVLRPPLIGISMPPGSLCNADNFIQKLNRRFNGDYAPILVLGQQLPTYYPEELLQRYDFFKGTVAAAMGEGERVFEQFIRVVRGEIPLRKVPNIIFLDNGRLVRTGIVSVPLSQLNFPAIFDTVPKMLSEGYGSALIQTSRGCSWGRCSYCTRTSFRNPGLSLSGSREKEVKRWEGFSLERVSKEIESLMLMGVRSIEFADDEFIGGRRQERFDRIQDLSCLLTELQKKHDLRISFRFFSRPDIIYDPADPVGNEIMRGLLVKLKQAGGERIFLGIEGSDDDSLRYFNRNLKLDSIEKAIEICRRIGFGLDAGYIMFYPEQTLKGILNGCSFFRRNRLISANQWPFRPIRINRGSLLAERMEEMNGGSRVSDAQIDSMSLPWEFSDKRVKAVYDDLQEVLLSSRQITYALKVLTKKSYGSCDKERGFAQGKVEKIAEIALSLMEQLARANSISSGRPAQEVLLKNARCAIRSEISEISRAINSGVLRDRDENLRKAVGVFSSMER